MILKILMTIMFSKESFDNDFDDDADDNVL